MTTLRLAFWSGPRAVSTALMRAWENRPDTFVCDEPLYAHYLEKTKLPHPGAEEVMAHGETDWRKVVAYLTSEEPKGKAIFYQKHMAHHLLPEISRDWLARLTHAFLIRHPREMLLSLDEKTLAPSLADTGWPQLVEIYEAVRALPNQPCPVVDAKDLLENPCGILMRLCATLDVPFSDSMLRWPVGRRATDGIWAKYWYQAVEQSTGFQPYQPRAGEVPPRLRDLYRQCLPFYEKLHTRRLTP